MEFILGFAAIVLGLYVLFLQFRQKQKKLDFFTPKNDQQLDIDLVDQSIIDLNALTKMPLRKRLQTYYYAVVLPLGKRATIKIVIFYLLMLVIGWFINRLFFQIYFVFMVASVAIIATILGVYLLRRIALKHFNESFPDALNMLASAITAGESLMHAIIYVGGQLGDNDVGREFKRMGERLQIGESPNVVLTKACMRFPYPEFIFFSITLRANIERGGQLRDIITQLNRVMFDARSLDKKKNAMTAEARMSAKIVFSIPFLFIIMMKFLMPENFNFLFNDTYGRYILYYVLASEAVGIVIISALMRGIK